MMSLINKIYELFDIVGIFNLDRFQRNIKNGYLDSPLREDLSKNKRLLTTVTDDPYINDILYYIVLEIINKEKESDDHLLVNVHRYNPFLDDNNKEKILDDYITLRLHVGHTELNSSPFNRKREIDNNFDSIDIYIDIILILIPFNP